MRLSGTVNGRPAIAIAFAPDKKGQMCAICLGLGSTLVDVPLANFQLPKLPKKLARKIKIYTRRQTLDAQKEVVETAIQ